MATEGITQLSDATFFSEIQAHPGLALVDFWAPWCGPCRMVAPVLEELARELTGQVKVTKMNVDENQVIPQQLGVRSIPTLVFYRDGQVVDVLVGAAPKQSILQRLRMFAVPS